MAEVGDGVNGYWKLLELSAAPPDKACSPGTGPDLAEDKDGAEMGEVEVKVKTEEFLATGRTGRRNALPDISDELAAYTSTGDLPLDMAKLSCAVVK
nr:hypothetical protein BaRGS_031331 [Batillaria attramentaria]